MDPEFLEISGTTNSYEMKLGTLLPHYIMNKMVAKNFPKWLLFSADVIKFHCD